MDPKTGFTKECSRGIHENINPDTLQKEGCLGEEKGVYLGILGYVMDVCPCPCHQRKKGEKE